MKVFRDNWLAKRRNYQSANVELDPEKSPPAVLPRPQVVNALGPTSFEMETESNPLAGPLPSSGEFDNPVFKPQQQLNANAHTPTQRGSWTSPMGSSTNHLPSIMARPRS